MKDVLSKNWFKMIITFSIILACIAISYYFLVYLPKGKALNNRIKCQQDGTKLYNYENSQISTGSFSSPEFKFNKKLDTCLYKGSYFDRGYINSFIIDVYTNVKIVEWVQLESNNEWKDMKGTKQEWENKINELFNKN